MLTDAQILKLYKDEKFPGSFTGAKTFQQFLKTEKNENISLKKIYALLQSQPFVIYQMKSKKRFPRRQYDTKYFLELVQCDLGQMYSYEGFHYFLLIFDVYSNKIWIKNLKTKDTKSVQEAFKEFFNELPYLPTQISTDQGKEFISLKKFFESKEILLTFKYGQNKANFAEYSIFLVKSRLYKLLRSKLSDNWPKYIQFIVDSLNKRPLLRLGKLTPNDAASIDGNLKVEEALKKHNLKDFEEPSWKDQVENEKLYESSKNPFKVGAFVYLDAKTSVFDKSFSFKRGQIFIISQVEAGISPTLYKLKDLLDDPVPGRFYRHQLKIAPNAKDPKFVFEIEKTLDERGTGKNKEVLVKFLFYPEKFNKWIPAKNIVNKNTGVNKK